MRDNPLAEFARATEPRPGAMARLRGARHPALDTLGAVPTGRRARPPRSSTRRATALLAAALALLAAGGWWLAPRAPRALDTPLVARERTLLLVAPRVRVAYLGQGHAHGTDVAPRVQWDQGTLELAIEPGAGIDLVVETADGSARAIGTAFTVRRDAMGTTVAVDHGTVGVWCRGEPTEERLVAGGERTCLPVRPAAMLGRARALRDGGASAEEVLDAVARGLSLAEPTDPATGELMVVELEVLLAEGRRAEAMAVGHAYLATGATSRREAIEALCDPNRADVAP